MSAETALAIAPTPPDIEALMASPEFQARMALLTQQAAAQLAALVEALRAAEAALGAPKPPEPPVPTLPVDGIPDGLPWEPTGKVLPLEGGEPPVFLAPAVMPQTEVTATRDAVARLIASLTAETPPSVVSDLVPLAAAAVLPPEPPAAAGAFPATSAQADTLPGFDSFTTWSGAEGTGV